MPSENIMEVKQIVHISNIKVLLKLSSHIFPLRLQVDGSYTFQ